MVQPQHNDRIGLGKALRSLGIGAHRRPLFVPGVQRRVPQAVACGDQRVALCPGKLCTACGYRDDARLYAGQQAQPLVCERQLLDKCVPRGFFVRIEQQRADLTGRKNAAVRPLSLSVSRTAAVFLSGAP